MDAPVYKLVFTGASDTPIHALYMLPPGRGEAPVPCVVIFHGYSGSKGCPEDYAAWAMMGYAVLAVDIRGQGGETGNTLPQDYGKTAGWVTQGILDPEACYYRAISIDGLRAVRCAREQPEVNPDQVFVVGTSQGGGLALVVSALDPRIKGTVAQVPNMCHMDYGLLYSTGSVTEAADFVTRMPQHLGAVLRTLSYFDVMNLAERIHMPIRVTAGLKDTVCMPQTIFAAYNKIPSADKAIQVFPFMGHAVEPGHRQAAHAFFSSLS